MQIVRIRGELYGTAESTLPLLRRRKSLSHLALRNRTFGLRSRRLLVRIQPLLSTGGHFTTVGASGNLTA